jgi:hypothetical protein
MFGCVEEISQGDNVRLFWEPNSEGAQEQAGISAVFCSVLVAMIFLYLDIALRLRLKRKIINNQLCLSKFR